MLQMPRFRVPVLSPFLMKCAAVGCVFARCAHAAVQIPGNKLRATSNHAGPRTSTSSNHPPPATTITQVYTNLSSDMISFYDQLRNLHRAHLNDLAIKRLENEHVLDEQQMTALIENSSNAKIQATLLSLDDHIRNLRGRATEVRADITQMRKDFVNLNTNLSAAIDFAGEAVKRVKSVTALREVQMLTAAEKNHKASKSKARLIQTIRGKHPRVSAVTNQDMSLEALALVQLGAGMELEEAKEASGEVRRKKSQRSETKTLDNPRSHIPGQTVQDLEKGFQHVNLEVGSLSKLHQSHLASLERDLKVRFDEGNKEIAKLIQEQQKLNITHGKLKRTAPELIRAVRELLETRAFLIHQRVVLSTFLREMGNQTAVLDHIEKGKTSARKGRGGRHAASIGGTLNLLQSGSQPRRKPFKARVQDFDHEADMAFRSVVGQVSELESELLRNRVVAASALDYEQRKFQEKLEQQSKENVRLAYVNNDLAEDLRYLRTTNTNLEDRARDLNNMIMLLSKDVAGAQASLVVAQAFITETLQEASAKSNHSFRLLTKMDDEDRAPVEEREHAKALAAIRDAWKNLATPMDDDLSNTLVLLDTGLGSVALGDPRRRDLATSAMAGRAKLKGQEYEDELSAEEMTDAPSDFVVGEDMELDDTAVYPNDLTTVEAIMSSMQANLHMLSNAHVTSVQELQDTYQATTEICKQSTTRLKAEHDGLTTMIVSATSSNKKLTAVVEKLEKAESKLQNSARSLRTYIGALGRSVTQNAVGHYVEGQQSLSFLQMTSRVVRRAKEPLKGEGEALAMAAAGEALGGKTFRNVASRASALQQKLQEMEMQSKDRLAAHKAEYEQRLSGMADANQKLSLSLQEIQAQNQNLMTNTMRLRTQSADLKKDCEVLTTDLVALQANFSKAMDFLTTSLHDIKSKQTPELTVLDELDEQDRVNTAHRDKQRRLVEIASSVESRPQTSLLQMRSIETPQSLLRGLEGSVGELGDEYESLESGAKASFQAEAQRLREEHARLLSAKDAKLSENQALQQLQNRLKAAVASLEAKRDMLEDRSRSLRSFAKRLSGREAPELLTKPRQIPQQLDNGTANLAGSTAVQSVPVTALNHVMESLLQVPHAPKQRPEQPQQVDATASSPIGAGKIISWFTR